MNIRETYEQVINQSVTRMEHSQESKMEKLELTPRTTQLKCINKIIKELITISPVAKWRNPHLSFKMRNKI